MLTTTLHWNLQWTILDHLFDKDFHVSPAFLADVPALQRRLRCAHHRDARGSESRSRRILPCSVPGAGWVQLPGVHAAC